MFPNEEYLEYLNDAEPSDLIAYHDLLHGAKTPDVIAHQVFFDEAGNSHVINIKSESMQGTDNFKFSRGTVNEYTLKSDDEFALEKVEFNPMYDGDYVCSNPNKLQQRLYGVSPKEFICKKIKKKDDFSSSATFLAIWFAALFLFCSLLCWKVYQKVKYRKTSDENEVDDDEYCKYHYQQRNMV